MQQVPATWWDHDEHRKLILDERDRAMLEFSSREAFGMDVGQLFQLEGAFEATG